MADTAASTPASASAKLALIQTPASAPSDAKSASLTIPASAPGASAPATIAITLQPAPSPPWWESSAVGVGALTLLGVVITIIFAHMRMRSELDHAAKEARVDRLSNTRREIYLEAVENLIKAQVFIGSLGKTDLFEPEYHKGMSPFMASANKVAVVGEVETVTRSRELVTIVNRLYFRALALLLPASLYKRRVDENHVAWEGTQVEIKRILAAMTHHNEEVKNDPTTFIALTLSFQAQQKMAAGAAADERNAQGRLDGERLKFANFIVSEAAGTAKHLDLLVDCIRKELTVKTDFGRFQAHTEKQLVQMNEALDELKAAAAQFQKDKEEGKLDD